MEQYNSQDYYEAFKKVRNRLRRYDANEILRMGIARLRTADFRDAKQLSQCPPWFILLLLKWTILYGDFSSYGKRKLSTNDFNKLINLIHAIDRTTTRLPNQFENCFLFLRRIAYQQFWFQELLSPNRLGRQARLFGRLPSNHRFQQWFCEETGLAISDFLELSFALLTACMTDGKDFVSPDFFRSIEAAYPTEAIPRLLQSLSKTPSELRAYLEKQEPKKKSPYEFYERTPLLKYPLLKMGDRYYCYHSSLLLHMLNTFVYDVLRARDPEAFMSVFGTTFERYVEQGLAYAQVEYTRESDIKRLVPQGAKTVDFFVRDEATNVFVDAKGVEMAQLGMVSHRPDVIRDKVKSSVIKGVSQGVETAQALSSSDEFAHRDWTANNNYLIIVTFKDLYVGNGECLQAILGRDFAGSNSESQIIPMGHIYCLTIDEFDWLVTAIGRGHLSVGSVLQRAVERDSNPQTMCFLFSQHLNQEDRAHDVDVPEYISQEFDELTRRCMTKIKENAG